MHLVETRHVRRFVVRLEPGEDVVATLAKLVRTELHRAGWIRGRGVLAWADVASWDDDRRAWRTARHLEGPFVLAALEGTITTRVGEPSVELDATLVREREGAPVAAGGRLVAAAALSVELLVEVFEDVRLERQDDDALGMPVWRGDRVPGVTARARGPRDGRDAAPAPATSSPRPEAGPPAPAERRDDRARDAEEEGEASVQPSAPPAPAEPAIPAAWAAVAAASAEREREAHAGARPAPRAAPSVRPASAAPSFLPARRTMPELAASDETRAPQRGDWVEHRQFGLCRVEGEDADGGTRVRLPSGARKTLRLDVLDVLPPRREADRTIFPVRPRSR